MNQPFQIFSIKEEDVIKIAAAPDEPHHHDFEELIIGIDGRLEHFIDFKSTTIQAPFVSFVTRGKIHRVLPGTENGVCNMWVLRFKSEFIAETTYITRRVTDVREQRANQCRSAVCQTSLTNQNQSLLGGEICLPD